MRYALQLAGLAALTMALLPPKAGVTQVLMQRDVSLKMALTIAEAAVAECEKTGNSVSVAVVDRAGRLRVFLQGTRRHRTISNWRSARPIRRAFSAAPRRSGRSAPARARSSQASASSNTSLR
jgi:uncharacterized protein GlcG (DUF336 family)